MTSVADGLVAAIRTHGRLGAGPGQVAATVTPTTRS